MELLYAWLFLWIAAEDNEREMIVEVGIEMSKRLKHVTSRLLELVAKYTARSRGISSVFN